MNSQPEIDPVLFTRDLQATFRRYLYTSNLICDSERELQDRFWHELQREMRILNGPFVHCTPAYKPGASLADLIQRRDRTRLSEKFLSLPKAHFDPARPLHSHQAEAIERAIAGRNLIVATGTGSGKTECFMLPILQTVFAEPGPGLRAIVVYPMNALANDQLERLRKLLANTPEVTFGRYTSDTPKLTTDEERRAAGATGNERFSRQEMRAKPPSILLTNFAMLEYLLLRPRDAELFDGHRLRFIVLDEAHSYGGAQGIEIALLMRRLKEYLGLRADALQFLLTSATIGGPAAGCEVVKFAGDLTGQVFAEEDLLRGETVTGFATELDPFPSHALLRALIPADEDAANAVFDEWMAALQSPSALHRRLEEAGFACGPLAGRDAPRLLFDLLRHSQLLARLHELCRRHASSFAEVCAALDLPNDEPSRRGLSWLIAMGAHARSGPENTPLLPTRLHFFCRGLAGATVCLNEACDGQEPPRADARRWSAFYLEDRKKCAHCECAVLPLHTCVHCGMTASKIFVRDDKWRASDDLIKPGRPVLLTWLPDLDEIDDPDENEEDEKNDGGEQTASAMLCLSCHAYTEDGNPLHCCTTPAQRRLRRLTSMDEEGNLAKCPRCSGGAGDFPTILRSFITGEDAPAAVLTETLMRHLPPNDSVPRPERLPANGRNLLVFSDSRQRAAFFAPYLSQTMAETAYLGPIQQAIEQAERREDRAVTVEEAADEYVRNLKPAILPMAVIRKRDDAGLETHDFVPTADLGASNRSAARREAQVSLFRHVCASTKQRGTLTGLGIAALAFDISDYRWDDIAAAVPALFAAGSQRGRELVASLLTVFAQKGAIAFPAPLTVRDVRRYGPPSLEVIAFHRTQSGGRTHGLQVIRWNPYHAPQRSKKTAVNKSRQLSILARALSLDRFADEAALSALLNELWDQFTESILEECEAWPQHYRLKGDAVMLTTRAEFFACNVCGRLTTGGELRFCASPDCSGVPRPVDLEDRKRRFGRNHYRTRYSLSALPLRVREHTAQLTNLTGKRYQEEFISGKVNVLSSSTTFEMGVDVGGLKAVLLRNVPPRSSNYVQRAGRAGRRKDGVSVAVTYARNAPHDQFLYQHAAEIIEGQMPVPFINITNAVLAQRHVNSLLLGYFLRALAQDGFDEKTLNSTSVADFFLTTHAGGKLVQRYGLWLRAPALRAVLADRLAAMLPQGIAFTPKEALTESERSLAAPAVSVLADGVLAPLTRFEDQLAELGTQMNNAGATFQERTRLARAQESLHRLAEQFKNQRLIDFLSSESWLPGFAFPQNAVKLLVRHTELREKTRLERDREIGISEYAPGAEIIADGWLVRSGAVGFNAKEPDVRFYTRCPQCRKISTYLETQVPRGECDRCGTHILHAPKRYLKPHEFSTLAEDEPREPGLYRRRPPRNSDIFLLEGADDFANHPTIPGVSYGVRRNGKMFRANSGNRFDGFKICRKCGRWFEKRPAAPQHMTPWGNRCSGRLIDLHLAHELVTDILQLRFNHCSPPAPQLTERSFWLSFQAAFLNGCCDALGIDFNDLGATFNGWTEESPVGELVIYDRVPGGAGHIDRIVAALDQVLDKTLRRVADCKGCTDLAASCYACLRTYSNQTQWDQLQRAPVIDWLSAVLKR